jgi:hypothetical protein
MRQPIENFQVFQIFPDIMISGRKLDSGQTATIYRQRLKDEVHTRYIAQGQYVASDNPSLRTVHLLCKSPVPNSEDPEGMVFRISGCSVRRSGRTYRLRSFPRDNEEKITLKMTAEELDGWWMWKRPTKKRSKTNRGGSMFHMLHKDHHVMIGFGQTNEGQAACLKIIAPEDRTGTYGAMGQFVPGEVDWKPQVGDVISRDSKLESTATALQYISSLDPDRGFLILEDCFGLESEPRRASTNNLDEFFRDRYVWRHNDIHPVMVRQRLFEELSDPSKVTYKGELVCEMEAGDALNQLVHEALEATSLNCLYNYSGCDRDAFAAYQEWISIQKEKCKAVAVAMKENGSLVEAHIKTENSADAGHEYYTSFERGNVPVFNSTLQFFGATDYADRYPQPTKVERRKEKWFVQSWPILVSDNHYNVFEGIVCPGVSESVALAISRHIAMSHLREIQLKEAGF